MLQFERIPTQREQFLGCPIPVSAKRNKHLKPDRDTNLNDPRSEVDRTECNLRLVWSSMEQKIEFSIAKSGFRLA